MLSAETKIDQIGKHPLTIPKDEFNNCLAIHSKYFRRSKYNLKLSGGGDSKDLQKQRGRVG